MPNPNPSPSTRFVPGRSGNPGGKPVGSRNRIQGDFLRALAHDFEAHGREVIRRVREDRPADYLRIVASVIPNKVEVRRPLDDLSDEQLDAAIEVVQAIIAAQGRPTGVDER